MSNKIAKSAKISKNVTLKGDNIIGNNCVIEGYCILENVVIGDNVHIQNSTLTNCQISQDVRVEDYCVLKDTKVGKESVITQSNIDNSEVGEHCLVGPFAHLRPHSKLNGYNKIGAFVQLKNSEIGEHSTASHLAYIGDATVGKYVNIGCGVVFVNYDGREKYHTQVGDYCFIGCHTNLIAPMTLGEHCFIAAGATLTKDIPANSFVIGRSTPTVKTNTRFNHE